METLKNLRGRDVLSRRPMLSVNSWVGSIFLLCATLTAAFIVVRHGSRISADAFGWMALGVVAAWLYAVRVWLFHLRLHRYIANLKPDDHDLDFVLDEAVRIPADADQHSWVIPITIPA